MGFGKVGFGKFVRGTVGFGKVIDWEGHICESRVSEIRFGKVGYVQRKRKSSGWLFQIHTDS
jgi:hypothetical protein